MRLFQAKDKSGRQIYLTDERWTHIVREHPEVSPYLHKFAESLLHPMRITDYEDDRKIKYYYTYDKQRTLPAKYLLIIVKYLNGEGFIITAYFMRHLQ